MAVSTDKQDSEWRTETLNVSAQFQAMMPRQGSWDLGPGPPQCSPSCLWHFPNRAPCLQHPCPFSTLPPSCISKRLIQACHLLLRTIQQSPSDARIKCKLMTPQDFYDKPLPTPPVPSAAPFPEKENLLPANMHASLPAQNSRRPGICTGTHVVGIQ